MATSTLITPCCTQCSHSPGQPCADLVACIENGPLCHDDEACRSERAARLDRVRRGGDGPIMFVGAGTCGRANGALRILEKMQAYLWDRSLPVTLVEVGCVGYCQREVFVDLRMDGTIRLSYCDLSPENVDEFLDVVFEKKELRNRFLYGRYGEAPGFEDVPLVMETPFFSKQTRVVLENCGLVDPASLDSAR
jgi:NADH-quinone oxidoreductase subunit F